MSGYYGGIARGEYAAHTHSIAAPTTDADVLKATGAIVAASVTAGDGIVQQCIAGCNSSVHSVGAAQVETNVLRASSPSKVAAVTGIPAVTGAPV